MTKINKTIVALVLMSTLGCMKLVNIGPPNDKIVTETVFDKDETAISALTSIYARMNREGSPSYNIALLTGIYGDELKNFSSTNQLIATYTNALNQINPMTPNLWGIAYNHIFHSNAVYEACEESTTLSSMVKKQLMAEARFVRSFWYFYLTNLFGNVPLILTTAYNENSIATNSTQAQIYTQIISDLKYGIENLNPGYVAGNTISSSTERVRPNATVAKALLSRAYLYSKDYENAEIVSSEVINNPMYKLELLENVFFKTSKEVIWQIQTPSPSSGSISATPEAVNFVLKAKPGSGSVRCSAISGQLLNSFETGDMRRIKWIGEFKDISVSPSVSYYFPFKYKATAAATQQSEYTTPLRLAEQYLIRAESRARLEKYNSAIADVDTIRKRAGLPLISITNPNISKEALILTIEHERQVELFCEWGHRWMDLKRSNRVDETMTTVSPSKGGSWSSYKALWPIPYYDIQNNKNIIQNDGYK